VGCVPMLRGVCFLFLSPLGFSVVRIFLPLSLLSAVSLIVAMTLGLSIDNPKVLDKAVQAGVQYHFLSALAALVFATLVHAIVLTYFMGTGRWIEETSTAYRLSPELYERSKSIKYRTIPAMVGCFVLLVFTGALGAAADPAAPMQWRGVWGVSAATIHLTAALVTILANFAVNYLEFRALERHSEIVDEVLAQVRQIRLDKGLAV
jgi:hypothetical protein